MLYIHLHSIQTTFYFPFWPLDYLERCYNWFSQIWGFPKYLSVTYFTLNFLVYLYYLNPLKFLICFMAKIWSILVTVLSHLKRYLVTVWSVRSCFDELLDRFRALLSLGLIIPPLLSIISNDWLIMTFSVWLLGTDILSCEHQTLFPLILDMTLFPRTLVDSALLEQGRGGLWWSPAMSHCVVVSPFRHSLLRTLDCWVSRLSTWSSLPKEPC